MYSMATLNCILYANATPQRSQIWPTWVCPLAQKAAMAYDKSITLKYVTQSIIVLCQWEMIIDSVY